MRHGTNSMYTNKGCRCEACTEAARERHRRYRAKERAIVVAAKDRPCEDCGQRYPTSVMEFDHRNPATKRGTISEKKLHGQALLREIERCDVVCANCHRLRQLEGRANRPWPGQRGN